MINEKKEMIRAAVDSDWIRRCTAFTELSGRLIGIFTENLSKITLILEPDCNGNVKDVLVGLGEELTASCNPDAV